MKKFVLNISDYVHEKFRFEAILQKKSVQQVIQERIFFKPFNEEVEEAFDNMINDEIKKIIGG